ncbi:MAG: NADH-quinone oxidoreductase subunit M [Bacteroidales bacterium]|nr:NADH-quinone oxidoreductase subunit M [Bacteroidales bacterium]
MDNPLDTLRMMLLAVLALPLVCAVVTAAVGCCCPGLARRVALLLALIQLGLTGSLVFLAADTLVARAGWTLGTEATTTYFEPIAVPGDQGFGNNHLGQVHETTWSLLTFAPVPQGLPPAEVQFYVGLDGLNVWLVMLTSLMTVVAILISWEAIQTRPGAFYAWLFALQTGIIGAFVAFDAILFYVFFELTLIPSFFLIGYWGGGPARRDAAKKFFLYTLCGSLLTLVGIVGVVLTNPTPVVQHKDGPLAHYGPLVVAGQPVTLEEGPITFSIPRLMRNVQTWADYHAAQVQRSTESATRTPSAEAQQALTQAELTNDRHRAVQVCLFFLLMMGFAVKTPILPLHTWLPSAYGEAPIGMTLILAALLSKLGTFGILRVVIPLTPDAAFLYGLPVFGFLGAVGIVYAALCAFAQRDIKLLVAYSSVSHLGLIILGLFTLNREGLSGATLHMLNHGLSTGTLFALLAFLIDRYRTLDMRQYGGLIGRFPGFAFLLFVVCLASVGLPGLNNFISEMLMLAGLFEGQHTQTIGYGLAVAGTSGIILSAWYTMTMLKCVLFSPHQEPAPVGETPRDLNRREAVAFGVPAALCLLLGLYPQPVLDTIRPDTNVIVRCCDQARVRAGYEPSPAEVLVQPETDADALTVPPTAVPPLPVAP